MTLPRPRFTVLRLMLVVAIVAVVLGARSWYEGRSARFREMARRYSKSWLENADIVVGDRESDETQARRSEHHRAMWEKYLRASRQPWLPVEPDPPEPE
jgi:hypothetical protein